MISVFYDDPKDDPRLAVEVQEVVHVEVEP